MGFLMQERLDNKSLLRLVKWGQEAKLFQVRIWIFSDCGQLTARSSLEDANRLVITMT